MLYGAIVCFLARLGSRPLFFKIFWENDNLYWNEEHFGGELAEVHILQSGADTGCLLSTVYIQFGVTFDDLYRRRRTCHWTCSVNALRPSCPLLYLSLVKTLDPQLLPLHLRRRCNDEAWTLGSRGSSIPARLTPNATVSVW